jgi:hypothetical protein
MPEVLERELKTKARKKGLSKRRTGAYVYGTLRKTGWTPSMQKRSVVGEAVRQATR